MSRSRHSSANSTTSPAPPKPDCLSFNPRGAKQPLYRPASLRRNDSASINLLHAPSPPLSPAPSSTDLKSSWLAGLATTPWSPSGSEFRMDGGAPVRGTMLPKSLWKPDDEVVECAHGDCSVRFNIIDRKHHCRRCGQVYCAAHSSRNSLLWPPAEESTPGFPTPRTTPRSSLLDIPSLVPYFTSSNPSSATPTSSPPNSLPPPALAVEARVCDNCFFSSETITPPTSSYHTSAKPLYFGQPPSTYYTQSPVTPAQSPPEFSPPQIARHGNRGNSRSRQGSGTSSSLGSAVSTNTSPSTSTVASSLDAHAGPVGVSSVTKRQRGVSPATSIRPFVPEEEFPGLDEEDEGEESDRRDDDENELKEDSAFGSVNAGWGQNWATF